MKKMIALTYLVIAGYTAVLACTWTWAPGSCLTTSCPGNCALAQTGQYLFYCQVQDNYCCNCQEEVFSCTGGSCPVYS